MTKKRSVILVIILFIFFILISEFINFTPLENKNTFLEERATETTLIYRTEQFTDYVGGVLGETGSIFTDNRLCYAWFLAAGLGEAEAGLEPGEISTNFLTCMKLKFVMTTTYNVEDVNVTVFFNYTDSTTVKLKECSNLINITDYLEVEFQSGKVFQGVYFYVYCNHGGTIGATVGFDDLEIKGYFPEVSDVYCLPSVQVDVGTPVGFYGKNASVGAVNALLFVKYEDTDITNSYQMQSDLFNPSFLQKMLTFNFSGNYFWKVRVFNGWNYTDSELKLLQIAGEGESYPKTAYINYWTPFSTFAIPSTLKQYIAENDELIRICDFSEFENRGTNLTWRAFSGAGELNYTVANQRLYVNASGNGVKADLKETINVDVYDSITFQLKVKNTSEFLNETDKALYVIMNPSAWTADYRLNLLDLNLVLNRFSIIIIPFTLFSFQYESNALTELGFYSPASAGVLDCEIREIYAADYLNFTTYLNSTNATTNQTSLTTELEYAEFDGTDIEFESSQYDIYDKQFIDDGFEDLEESSEFVEIVDDELLTTNNTGHYKGFWTFFSDEIGGNPAGWTISESFGSIDVENYNTHNKVVEVYDSSSSGGVSGYRVLESLYSDSTGVIDFWYSSTTLPINAYYSAFFYDIFTNKRFGLFSPGRASAPPAPSRLGWSGNDISESYLYDYGGNYILIDDGCWYKIKIVFSLTAHYCNLYYRRENQSSFNLAYQDTSHTDSQLEISSSLTNINKFYVDTGYTANNYYQRFDSFYFDWLGDTVDIDTLIDCEGNYLTGVIDFGEEVTVENVTIGKSEDVGMYVTTKTDATMVLGSWWKYFNSFKDIKTQYLKFWVFLICLDYKPTEMPILDNITINLMLNPVFNSTQNLTKTFSIERKQFINASIDVRIKCDVSEASSISVYNFNDSQFEYLTTINQTYQIASFILTNNKYYSDSKQIIFNISSNSSSAHSILLDYVEVSLFYYQTDKFSLIANQTVSLTDDDIRISFRVQMNSSSYIILRMLYNNASYQTFILTENKTYYYDLNSSIDLDYFEFTIYKENSLLSEANATGFVYNLKTWQNKTYRLLSDENRQVGNILSIPSEEFSLLLTDYWGNTIYRERLNYTQYLDILVPYFTISIKNEESYEIIFQIEKKNSILSFVIAPGDILYLDIISDDYTGFVITPFESVYIFDECISRTSRRSFSYQREVELDDDRPSLDLWKAFLEVISHPLFTLIMFILMGVISSLVLIKQRPESIYWKAQKHKKMEKEAKKAKKTKEKEEKASKRKRRKRDINPFRSKKKKKEKN